MTDRPETRIEDRLATLAHIESVYDRFVEPDDLACERGCPACCTRNVTLTTLEALRIAEQLPDGFPPDGNKTAEVSKDLETSAVLFARISAALDKRRFQPRTTGNGIAAACLSGGEVPAEDDADPAWGPCPLLTDNECPIYPVRPFGCRCFVSTVRCGSAGHAEVPPFIVTVNNVFLQYIEHIDADGGTGNLTDLLAYFKSERVRTAYREGTLRPLPEPLVANQPVPALMIPPRHRARIRPILEALAAPITDSL